MKKFQNPDKNVLTISSINTIVYKTRRYNHLSRLSFRFFKDDLYGNNKEKKYET